jgi:hypothetical protein
MTAPSLEIAPTWAKISAVFSALDREDEGKEDGEEKIKGRPMAADEKTGEADIFSRNCQAKGREVSPANFGCSPFIRQKEYLSRTYSCQAIRSDS